MRILLLLAVLAGCAPSETRREPTPTTSPTHIASSAAVKQDASPPQALTPIDTAANSLDSSHRGPKPGQRINVEVQVKSIVNRGDTIGITYQVKNLVGSEEALLSFLVDAPSGVVSIATPSPKKNWYASTDFRQRPMAIWDLLGHQLPAGEVTPDLSFQSVGLPGVSTFWAGGKFKLPSDEDAAETEVDDPLANEMINGVTVGVEPLPSDRSPTGLLKRLSDLTDAVCKPQLLWLTDTALCSQLASDLNQAGTHSASGKSTEAREVLSHYIKILEPNGTRAAGVSTAAYWLLKSNAEIIKARL